ncbi:MAG TPA: hypothetical protein VMB74_18640 [Streptosporangiaceae bacterium]|nr:hypothetical protein [Streptosporangiaceae bacterium]
MRTKDELLELREQAVTLRRAGKSRSEIKEILGVGNSTLGPALRGEPPPLWTLRARAKDDQRAKARELRASGCTYDEIAAELGVSKGSVSLWAGYATPRPAELRRVSQAQRRGHSQVLGG